MATDKASAQNSDAAEKQQTGASVRENADASLAGEEGAHTAGAACAVENSQGNKTPFISEVSGHHRRYLKLLEFTHSTTKAAGFMLLGAILSLIVANSPCVWLLLGILAYRDNARVRQCEHFDVACAHHQRHLHVLVLLAGGPRDQIRDDRRRTHEHSPGYPAGGSCHRWRCGADHLLGGSTREALKRWVVGASRQRLISRSRSAS